MNNPNDLRLDDESGAWFADPKRFKNGWSELSRATTFLENVWKFECKWMKGEYLSWFRGWNAGAFQGFIMWHHPTHDQKIRCSPMILFMWNSRTAEDFRYVAWTLKRVCQARAYSSCIYHIYYIIYIIFNFPKHLVNYTYEIMHPLVIYIYIHIYIYWLVVWNMIFMTFHILGIMIPTDELIFFRGVGIPPTSICVCRLKWVKHDDLR